MTQIKFRLGCVKRTFCLNHLDPKMTSLYPEEVLLVQPTKLESHCPGEGGLLCTTGNKEVKFLALEWKIQAQTKRQALWFNEVSFSFLFSPNTHTCTPLRQQRFCKEGRGGTLKLHPSQQGEPSACSSVSSAPSVTPGKLSISLGVNRGHCPPWGATSVILEDEVREDHPTPSVSQQVNDDELAGVMLFWAPQLC